ncbi:MAG: ABC transporter substrate-binding protein [Actinomycetes bacterium]
MKLHRKAGLVVAVAALSATAVYAIPSANAANASWNGPAPTVAGAVSGGTLNILEQGDFEHVDPARNYVGGTLDFYRFFIRTLTQYRTYNGKTELVPDLASDLGTTKDGGLNWTFKLRSGIKYEDGTTATCADMKYGIERTYNDDVLDGGTTYAHDFLANPTGYAGPYTTPTKDLTSVTCSGDSISFKLAQKVPYFPYVTTFGAFSPIPVAKDTKQNYDLHPMSTGPYKIESYDRGKQMTLVRNSYWDPKTDPLRHDFPDTIKVKFGFEQNALEQQLISDSGDAKTAISTDTQVITNIGSVVGNAKYAGRFFGFDSPYARYLAINMDKVKNSNVRKAIQCAIDLKTVLLAAGGAAAGSYANSLIPSNVDPAYRNFQVCGRDVHKNPEAQIATAKKYLAGVTKAQKNLILAYRDKGVEPQRAAAAQAALQAVGFKVTMQKLPRAGYYTAIGKRGVANEPDVIQTSWGFDWPAASGIVYALLDGRTMTKGDSHSNYSRQNVPGIQALFRNADKASSIDAQETQLGDIEQKLIQDYAAVVPTYIETSNFIVGSGLGGVQADGGYGTISPINAYVKK